MLQIQHLRKAYAAATVLSDISLIINDSEHVALIGPNGAGKSTLLRCLIGAEQPDAGTIALSPPGQRIGYLAQSFEHLAGHTVRSALAQAQAEVLAAAAAVERAAEALASAQDLDAAMADYEQASAAFEALGGYSYEQHAAEVLGGLGLDGIDPDQLADTLSGGQKTRLGLALLLLSQPDLLLLDEPTNHLDVAALEWLEGFVRSYPRAALVVSHDRAFLDRTVTRTLYLDPDTRTVASYTGGYSDFAAAREREREAQEAAWQDQQLYIREVEADIRRVRGRAQSIQNGPKRGRDFYGGVSAKVARLARTRERKLERYMSDAERVERPRQSWGIRLDFGEPTGGSRSVLRVEDVSFAYPGAAPLLRDVAFELEYGERVALVGPNGAGKTTLLRLITGELAPSAGEVRLGASVRLGVMAQQQETLDPTRTVLETVRRARAMSETEARSFLHFFLFGGDSAFRTVGVCSLGERSRLQLALLVLAGCNLLVLDEPLNHLDIEGREHFEQALDAFEGTVLAVSHDRAFLSSFAERVIEVHDGGVRLHAGGYEG
ncbi:ABC-F family ATP-binding cassette domain-containing protein [Chloroflexia bacterium SDU3-3]|nr:ABC-F family ATP-binding cassette domain-containing protein [Chloroflexia bacterium SDU3-3]